MFKLSIQQELWCPICLLTIINPHLPTQRGTQLQWRPGNKGDWKQLSLQHTNTNRVTKQTATAHCHAKIWYFVHRGFFTWILIKYCMKIFIFDKKFLITWLLDSCCLSLFGVLLNCVPHLPDLTLRATAHLHSLGNRPQPKVSQIPVWSYTEPKDTIAHRASQYFIFCVLLKNPEGPHFNFIIYLSPHHPTTQCPAASNKEFSCQS